MTAEERAQELMRMPMNQWPSLAMAYANHVRSKIGWCGDVAFTAMAHYAQLGEGLVCDDPCNPHDEWDEVVGTRAWFAERQADEPEIVQKD